MVSSNCAVSKNKNSRFNKEQGASGLLCNILKTKILF